MPTNDPTMSPTPSPSYNPTNMPTDDPTMSPTPSPTPSPISQWVCEDTEEWLCVDTDFHKLIIHKEGPFSYKQLEAACEGQHLEVASIHSQKANDDILNVMNNEEVESCFIGLTNGDYWSWSDGTEFDFDNSGDPTDTPFDKPALIQTSMDLWNVQDPSSSANCIVCSSFVSLSPTFWSDAKLFHRMVHNIRGQRRLCRAWERWICANNPIASIQLLPRAIWNDLSLFCIRITALGVRTSAMDRLDSFKNDV